MKISENTRRILQSHISILSAIERCTVGMRQQNSVARQSIIRLGKDVLRNKKQSDPELLKSVMRSCDYTVYHELTDVAATMCEVAHSWSLFEDVKLYQQRRSLLARL